MQDSRNNWKYNQIQNASNIRIIKQNKNKYTQEIEIGKDE